MWEEILKRADKKLNHAFLKDVVLVKSRGMKGEVLSADEYLQFQEEIKRVYTPLHSSSLRGGVRLDLNRIRNFITRILKANNLLEIKRIKKNIYDSDGNLLGNRTVPVYYFI